MLTCLAISMRTNSFLIPIHNLLKNIQTWINFQKFAWNIHVPVNIHWYISDVHWIVLIFNITFIPLMKYLGSKLIIKKPKLLYQYMYNIFLFQCTCVALKSGMVFLLKFSKTETSPVHPIQSHYMYVLQCIF